MDTYENLSIDYDKLQPKEEVFKQKVFFRKLVDKYAVKTCLDCACGTGWHLYMLNNLGLKCSGSDLSDSMLKKARENLKSYPIPLKNENFRTLSKSWKEKFDMIICMTTSFTHNYSAEEAIKALNSMYDCLSDGGIIVIDNGFGNLFFKQKPTFRPSYVYENQTFYFFFEYPDPKKIIFNILNVKKTPTGFKHIFEPIHLMAMVKKDFDGFFRRTKFNKVKYYGAHDFSEYSEETSKRTIVIAQK